MIDEIVRTLEAWQDEGKNYITHFSFLAIAHEIISKLLANNSFDQIDIPDSVFQSKEAKAASFTKRSFLEAGWRKVK